MHRHQVVGRGDVAPVLAEVARWDAGGGYVTGLHVGDLGWHLRQPDDRFDGTVHAWWDGDELVAVALLEGVTARPRTSPGRLLDHRVAATVADVVEGLAGAEIWSDADPATAYRQELVRRGWVPDPDPWVALFADGRSPRSEGHPPTGQALDDVAARVAVQRSGFARSTFDEPSWHRMAAGPTYRPDLDLVLRDPADGRAVAVATAWLSVPGGPAILEPVATDRERQGRGFGRQVTTAAVAAALEAGASGVCVCTPASNESAVTAYRSAGLRHIETVQALMLDRSA